MTDAALTVKFGANVADLNAKMELAKAQVQSATVAMRNLAREMVATGAAANSGMLANLSLLSTTTVATKGHLADLQQEAANLNAGGLVSIGLSARMAAMDTRALLDEFSSGRIRQGIGSTVHLLGQIAMANPMLAAMGGAAILAGGAIAYLAMQAEQAKTAIQGVMSSAAVSGTLQNFSDLKGAAQGWYDELRHVGGISDLWNRPSSEDAQKIISSLASIEGASKDLIDAIVKIEPEMAKAFGDEPAQWAQKLGAAMNDPVNRGEQYLAGLRNITPQEQANFENAKKTGNIYQMRAAILSVLIGRYQTLKTELNQTKAQEQDLASTSMLALSADGQLDVATAQNINSFAILNSRLDETIRKLTTYRDRLGQSAMTPALTVNSIGADIKKANPVSAQIEATRDTVKKLEDDLRQIQIPDNAIAAGDQYGQKVRQIADALDEAKQHLAELQNTARGGSETQLVDLANLRQSVALGKNALRDAEAKVVAARKDLANAHTAVAVTQAQNALYQAQLGLQQQISERAQALSQRDALAAQDGSHAQTAAVIRGLRAQLAATEQGSTERQALINQITQAEQAQADRDRQIARDAENGKYQAALTGLQERMALIKQETQEGQISHAQQLAQLMAAQKEKETIEADHLTFLEKSYADDAVEYARAQAQKVALTAKSVKEEQQIIAGVNREVFNDYRHVFDRIGSSISSSIVGMISGQERFRDAARSILFGMLSDALSIGIKMAADHAAQIAMQVAQTLMGQQAQTAAVTAGVAARTAAEAGGVAGSLAASAAGLIQQVLADAKAAFAGVFAFLAPVMGPAAAGPAAGAMGAVMGMASFDKGSWQLPGDMVAQVHKGEMIVPAGATPWAQTLMSNAANSGSGSNYHFSPTIHFNPGSKLSARDLSDHAQTLVGILKDEFRRGAFTGFR